MKVGVFVNESKEEIERIASQVGLPMFNSMVMNRLNTAGTYRCL